MKHNLRACGNYLGSMEDMIAHRKIRIMIIVTVGLCLLCFTIGCVPPPPPGGEVQKEPPRQYGPSKDKKYF